MAEYTHGSMDISQHRGTYGGFCALVKWSTISIIILLILMAIFLL